MTASGGFFESVRGAAYWVRPREPSPIGPLQPGAFVAALNQIQVALLPQGNKPNPAFGLIADR